MRSAGRAKMPPSLRAKQFAPFAALGGLEAALAEKRREMAFVSRKVLSEEAEEELDRILRALKPGDAVRAVHYVFGEYRETEGDLRQISAEKRNLMVGEEKICFENLWRLEITRSPEGSLPEEPDTP